MIAAPAGTATPVFPPRLRGEAVAPGQPVLDTAAARAMAGIDPGLVVWERTEDRMAAAMVLAPELPLGEAMGGAVAVALGLGDALGALAPPEVAVHFDWPSGVRVNGARCGRIGAAASTDDAAAEPDWLAVAVTLDLRPPRGTDPGGTPDRTYLHEEGCAGLTATALLESWSRHSLVWLNGFEADGFRPLHEAWRGRIWGIGEPLPDGSGLFLGLDEHGNQLVRTPERTEIRPLTLLLEGP